jgi:hypothetical protein
MSILETDCSILAIGRHDYHKYHKYSVHIITMRCSCLNEQLLCEEFYKCRLLLVANLTQR